MYSTVASKPCTTWNPCRAVCLRIISANLRVGKGKATGRVEVRGEKQRISEANREKVVAEKRVKELEAQVDRLRRGRGAVNERAAELAELSSKLKVEVQKNIQQKSDYNAKVRDERRQRDAVSSKLTTATQDVKEL